VIFCAYTQTGLACLSIASGDRRISTLFSYLHELFPTRIVRPPRSFIVTLPTNARTIVDAGLSILSASVASHPGVWPSLASGQYPSTSLRIVSSSRWVGTPCPRNFVHGTDKVADAGPINVSAFAITVLEISY
jgi:hypothetical protein